MADDETKPLKDYLTTTELARFCGVSRFTIINWVNQNKIRVIRTIGGHYRIPVLAAISFLETLHKEREGESSGVLGHCWEHPQKTKCKGKCKNCLIYGRDIDYFFLVVRQFGKEVIQCGGDCLSCDYFKGFFRFYTKEAALQELYDRESDEAGGQKRIPLYGLAYGVGRGIHGLKKTAAGLHERLGSITRRENPKKKDRKKNGSKGET